MHQSDCLTHFVHASAASAKGFSIPPERCDAHIISHIFECMVSYIIYLHALFTWGVQHTLFLGGSKNFQQKPCAFVDFCSAVSFHWSKMLNTNPIKVNEVSPKNIR